MYSTVVIDRLAALSDKSLALTLTGRWNNVDSWSLRLLMALQAIID
jgi:hypothetical protein